MINEKEKAGHCPKCGNTIIDYFPKEERIESELGFYYICSGCKFEGIEWYVLKFVEHTNQYAEERRS